MARKLAMTTSKAIRSQRACTPPLVATFDFDGDVHFQLPIQAALRSQPCTNTACSQEALQSEMLEI